MPKSLTSGVTKKLFLTVRVTYSEMLRLKRAAEVHGKTISEFVRAALNGTIR